MAKNVILCEKSYAIKFINRVYNVYSMCYQSLIISIRQSQFMIHFLHQCSIQNQNYTAKSLFMKITIHGNNWRHKTKTTSMAVILM